MVAAAPTTVLFLSNLRRPGDRSDLSGDSPDPNLLSDGLAAAGFRVKARQPRGFPLNPLARMGTFYAGFDVIRALLVLVLDRRVDVVVSVGESNIAMIVLLARLLRFKPRIVLREISARGWPKRDRVVDFVLPRVDRVAALTPHQKAWAEATFRLKAPADLVGFAIDEVFFRPQGRQDGRYVLAVGDDFGRDYPCLIAACRGTPYSLVLRTDTNPAIPEDMRARVTIVGRLSFARLRDLYDAASIVVVPLREVDHPSGITALFEAMAMGRAVVASDVGSTRHVVKNGANGCLVAAGDAVAMGAAISALMQDDDLRKRLGENARTTIAGEFSYAIYIERFVACLRSAAAAD